MAETPPPYYGNMPKKSNTTTIVLIVLGVCAACCVIGIGGVGLMGWLGFKKIQPTIACAIGFEEAGKAMEDYANDHDGSLPPAASWQDAIRPYFAKETQKAEAKGIKMLGSFDPNGVWACTDDSAGRITGIAFNSDLGGQKVAKIKNRSTTVLLFETPKSGTNLNMPYVELSESSSPKVLNKDNPRGWMKVTADFKGTSNGDNTSFNMNDN